MRDWIIGLSFAFISGTLSSASEVPDVLTSANGRKADTPAVWESVRRPEVLNLFQTHVFGHNAVERPATLRFETTDKGTDMMDGKALRKRIVIRYSGPGGEGAIRVTAFIPKSAKPAPAFLLICNRPESNIDSDRFEKSPF